MEHNELTTEEQIEHNLFVRMEEKERLDRERVTPWRNFYNEYENPILIFYLLILMGVVVSLLFLLKYVLDRGFVL